MDVVHEPNRREVVHEVLVVQVMKSWLNSIRTTKFKFMVASNLPWKPVPTMISARGYRSYNQPQPGGGHVTIHNERTYDKRNYIGNRNFDRVRIRFRSVKRAVMYQLPKQWAM